MEAARREHQAELSKARDEADTLRKTVEEKIKTLNQVTRPLTQVATTTRKYALLPCGHLDIDSAFTAQNDEFMGGAVQNWPLLYIRFRDDPSVCYVSTKLWS